MSTQCRLFAVGIPLFLYLASLALPAAGSFLVGSNTKHSGAEAFLVGISAAFALEQEWSLERVGLAAAWWANPAIWLAIGSLAFGWRQLSIVAAGIGCVLCLLVLPRWG